jgi:hypothetical protein
MRKETRQGDRRSLEPILIFKVKSISLQTKPMFCGSFPMFRIGQKSEGSMESSSAQRARYRPSGRVAWGTFLPWAIGTAVIALAMGAGMNWLFQRGWYLLFVVPAFAALFGGLLVHLSIKNGKCRSPLVGVIFGLVVGVLIYGGFLYFGMLSLAGADAVLRFDLLPKYVLLRMRTDTSHDVAQPNDRNTLPDPIINGIKFAAECAIVLVFTVSAGSRRSRRAFCERCGTWKKQDLAVFPPGNGKVIAGWLHQGELARLSVLDSYSPRGRDRRATLVALERCEDSETEPCPVYLAVKDVSKAGASGRFDSAFGKLRVNRMELAPEEVASLEPLFPAAAKFSPPIAVTRDATTPSTPVGRQAFIEVKPLPPNEAHKVLSRSGIGIAFFLTMLILPVFYASIGGVVAGIYFSKVTHWLDHKPVDTLQLAEGLAFAAISLIAAIFSGIAGLRNASAIGNLYFRYLSRKAIASRRDKCFDPERPGDLPTHFVQIVPRKNWGTMKVETATDTGYLQIDHRRKELRFEGDVDRYRIPAAAITGCSIATYATSASSNLRYFIVVIQGNTPAGPWEAPISLRPTKLLPPKDHRRRSAEMLMGQITPLLAEQASPVSDGGDGVLPYFGAVESLALKPRVGWVSRFGLRLAIMAVVIAFAFWRGTQIRRDREKRLAQIAAQRLEIEPGEKTSRLPLTLTNIRPNQQIIPVAPYYADGGDWTVFDCAAVDDPGAAFTVAVERPKYLNEQTKIGFTQVALLPGTREAGLNLVKALAKALKQESPTTRIAQPLKTVNFEASFLGDHFGGPEQGLKPDAGTWTATMWSIENEGLDGEIYFNYNLASGRAEFAGTESDSDSDALLGIASAVRDGPRPTRSEQNDPNFTSNGPTVADLQLIPDSLQHRAIFAPNGKRLTYFSMKGPSTIYTITLDSSRQRTTIAQFDGGITSVISPDAEHFLVSERSGSDAMAFGPAMQQRIWWIDRPGNARTQLTGPWGSHGSLIGQERLSPDGRYAEISSLSGTVLDEKRTSVLFVMDLRTRKSIKAAVENVLPIGWIGNGASLRALVRKFGANSSDQKLLIDPVTGNFSPATSENDLDHALSPDGKLRFVVQPKASVAIQSSGGGQLRTFAFDEDDRRFGLAQNISWLSPRYLRLFTAKECFIDLATMKIGYLPTVDNAGQGEPYRYSADFKWALAYGKDGIKLGRVVVPDLESVPTVH